MKGDKAGLIAASIASGIVGGCIFWLAYRVGGFDAWLVFAISIGALFVAVGCAIDYGKS